MQYAKGKPAILRYFSDEKDWLSLDKKWVCDVLFTLDDVGIDAMIRDAKRNRKARLELS